MFRLCTPAKLLCIGADIDNSDSRIQNTNEQKKPIKET